MYQTKEERETEVSRPSTEYERWGAPVCKGPH